LTNVCDQLVIDDRLSVRLSVPTKAKKCLRLRLFFFCFPFLAPPTAAAATFHLSLSFFIFKLAAHFQPPGTFLWGPKIGRITSALSHTIEGISWRHFHFQMIVFVGGVAGMHLLVSPFRSGRRNPNIGRHLILVSLRPEDEKQSAGSSYLAVSAASVAVLLQFFVFKKRKCLPSSGSGGRHV
jgi:hypothetical protein